MVYSLIWREERMRSQNINKRSFLYGIGEMIKMARKADVKSLVGVIVLSLLSGVAAPAQLWILSRIINSLFSSHSASILLNLLPWFICLSLFRILENFSTTSSESLRNYLEEKMTLEIQADLLKKAYSVPYINYESQEFYDALHRANEGMGGVFLGFVFQLVKILENLVKIGGYVWITLEAHWTIALIILCGGVPILILQNKFNVERYKLVYDQTAENRLLNYFVQITSDRKAAKEVRLLNVSDYLINKWEIIYKKLRSEYFKQLSRQRIFTGMVELLPAISFAISLYLLFWSLISTDLNIGNFTIVIYAVTSLQNDWEWTIRYIGWLQEDYLRFVKDLLSFLNFSESSDLGENPCVVSHTDYTNQLRIDIENATFSYPNSSEKVLKNLTFSIQPGEKIALLGTNGSGKSTLIKMLLGLLKPTKGTISFNGCLDHTFGSELTQTSVVYQDYCEYHLSLKENIGLGDTKKSQSNNLIRKAAEKGGVNDFVHKLTDQYDTILGTEFKGVDLSGGQWQKVATSRSFFKEAKLIIFDEPASALDSFSEEKMYKRFSEIDNHTTAIMISHRIGFAKFADRIIVMDKGEIIESGSHDELIQLNKWYAKLLKLQQERYE